MKKRWIIWTSALVSALATIVVLAPLFSFFTAGLRSPLAVPAPEYWPTDGWRTKSPEEKGFGSTKLALGLLSLHDKQAPIDSLLIIHDGYLVLDAHFASYDGTFPHDLASVTKSVTTALIAIADEQGYLDLDQPAVSFFPDRIIANLDDRKKRITIRDLVSMRNGMQSNCYDGDESTLDVMRSQPDWVQAALDRPMVSEPGTKNCYDSPGMHLLSAILQEATGMSGLEFARINLFEPLGIHQVIWESDPQGYTRGWGDLHLLPEDAAKIGFLWLHRGQWDGRQVVPEAWVLDSVRPQSLFVKGDLGYGYGWWVAFEDYLAAGRGGQMIRVIASRNTILVLTGGYYEYSQVEKWLLPVLIGLKDSLPADPAGENDLAAALKEIRQDNLLASAVPAPEIAGRVSGKTYICEDDLFGIQNVRIDFSDSDQAVLYARINGVESLSPIGLDGRYRLTADGDAHRGYWLDAHTFRYDIFGIGLRSRLIVFDEDNLQVALSEVDSLINCKLQNP